jgi:hypothetical protein
MSRDVVVMNVDEATKYLSDLAPDTVSRSGMSGRLQWRCDEGGGLQHA